MPLNYQNIDILFGVPGAGLDTGADPRGLEIPALLRADNAVFPRRGGVEFRKPFERLGDLADIRRLASCNDELLAFTEDKLYSWSPALNDWQERDTHLAVATREKTVFASEAEQHSVSRAQIGNVVVYCWLEGDGTDNTQIAVLDSGTGAVLGRGYLGIGAVGDEGLFKGRVLAVGSRFHFYSLDDPAGELNVTAVEAADAGAFAEAGISTVSSVSGADTDGVYDIALDESTNTVYVVWRANTGTGYGINTVAEDGTVGTPQAQAEVADGFIACAVDADSDQFAVARADGTNVDIDVFDLALTQATATGTSAPVLGTVDADDEQVTVAIDGDATVHAWWTGNEQVDSTDYETKYNTWTSGGGAGTSDTFLDNLSLASHAFVHDGDAYVWMGFAKENSVNTLGFNGLRAQLQNSYFLYRDDGTLIAKAIPNVAGGFAQTRQHLPGVQETAAGVFACALVERRRIILGAQTERAAADANPNIATGYAARTPRETIVEFDSDKARRVAQVGHTGYVTGGQILQYDGEGLVELGFHIYPWRLSMAGLTLSTPSGATEEGQYGVMQSDAWTNARGELDRSVGAVVGVVAVGAGHNGIRFAIGSLKSNSVTLKQGSRQDMAREIWRTEKNPTVTAPYHLVTDSDPGASPTDRNGYLINDPGSPSINPSDVFDDDLADSSLATHELYPEGELEPIPPPPASIIYANDERVFLADVVNDPNSIWYSKVRKPGQVVQFNDALRVPVPDDVVAVVEQAEALVAFCKSSVYAIPGVGFDNNGNGDNYGPAQLRSVDVGLVNPDALAVTSDGTIFKSAKGWYLLDLGFSVRYIGAPVKEFDGEEVRSVDVVEDAREVRIVTENRILVFNTEVSAWSNWTIPDAVDAVVHGGKYYYATDDGVFVERADHVGVDYSLDLEIAPVRFGSLAGFGKVRRFQPVGECLDPCAIQVRVRYDDEDEYTDDRTHSVLKKGPLRLHPGPGHGFRRGRCQSAAIRLTVLGPDGGGPPNTASVRLTGISVKIGYKRGLGRLGSGRR